jgi:hypothetical protein
MHSRNADTTSVGGVSRSSQKGARRTAADLLIEQRHSSHSMQDLDLGDFDAENIHRDMEGLRRDYSSTPGGKSAEEFNDMQSFQSYNSNNENLSAHSTPEAQVEALRKHVRR